MLEQYFVQYNTKRPHQGRGMKGRTPITPSSKASERIEHATAKPDSKSRLTRACHGGPSHLIYPLCTHYGPLLSSTTGWITIVHPYSAWATSYPGNIWLFFLNPLVSGLTGSTPA